MAHYILTYSSSARQLVMKRGVGKVRHLDGQLLWVQNTKDFKMVQVPTDSNTAELGGQRTALGIGTLKSRQE